MPSTSEVGFCKHGVWQLLKNKVCMTEGKDLNDKLGEKKVHVFVYEFAEP